MILLKSKKKTLLDNNINVTYVSYTDLKNYQILRSKNFYKEENEFINYYTNIGANIDNDDYFGEQ